MPAISAFGLGFPKDLCAEIMLDAATDYIQSNPETALLEIRLTNEDSDVNGFLLRSIRDRRQLGGKKSPASWTATNNNNIIIFISLGNSKLSKPYFFFIVD